jgi:hypothetical protein
VVTITPGFADLVAAVHLAVQSRYEDSEGNTEFLPVTLSPAEVDRLIALLQEAKHHAIQVQKAIDLVNDPANQGRGP